MDPALTELLLAEGTTADQMIEAIIRLRRPGLDIPGVRMVARFGTVATCRLRTGDVAAVRAEPDEISLKLARPLGQEWQPPDPDRGVNDAEADPVLPPPRRPETSLTGARVVIGAMDWRLDFDHPSLKNADGSTRLLALWDQRVTPSARSPKPYGYGRVYHPAEINRALASRDPYRRLGYHPSAGSSKSAHGTHVIDIAAGNGRGGGPVGVAPEADLVFVHLADRGTGGLANLGDSVRLLEAAHFIATIAGPRPWVINSSVGRMGGPHDASLLVQRAIDEFLLAAPGRFLVQSAGNYRVSGTHASGVLKPGERRVLHFNVDPQDWTTNELEIWYDGEDEFIVTIDPPGRRDGPTVRLGDTADITRAGQLVGRVHHRAFDPNNHDHHIDAFLYPKAAGTWTVTLEARTVRSGRFHAWLERDEACPKCQARFAPDSRSLACTTGTIANGRIPLVVGAYDANDPVRPVARTSSSGQTRDGHFKPDLGAPGHRVRAARSAPVGSRTSPGGTVLMSGTSMATPHVTGAVALCLQASGGQVTAQQIRTLVLGSAHPPRTKDPERRLGHGYLDIAALLRVTQRAFAARTPTPNTNESFPKEQIMDHELDPVSPLVLAPGRACRELLYRPNSDLAHWIRTRYAVLGRPGERPATDLRAGDIVVQVALGHPTAGRCGIVAAPELTKRPGDAAQPAGWYAELSDPAVPFGSATSRVLDATRCLPAGSVLLRRRDPDQAEDDPVPGNWAGTPEQNAFRDRVLAAAIAAKKRPPQPNLRRDQLDTIAGTDILTRPATARAAEALLAAATVALHAAQQAGEVDALRTVRLTVTSGYRDDSKQRRLWLSYFRKYYNQTRTTREALPTGPHSDEALAYLMRSKKAGGFGIGGRIAAPGFSNHQAGIAVDLWQERIPGHRISNDTDPASRARWRGTWFHKWLVAHAAEHGFQPLATEEWHWEHQPADSAKAAGPTAAAAAADPNLWTFRPTDYNQPVAIYYPEAARAAGEVDVVLFAHGLIRGCPAPAQLPSGFVSDPPFRLGRVVERSGRPVVLVVPMLDWANPGGKQAFGRERWHALSRPDHLNSLVGQVMAELGRRRPAAAPTLRKLIIAGHSRAYDFLEPLAEQRRDPAMQRGALAKLAQVWAFDTTYAGRVERWTDWLAANPDLQVHVFFRPGSRTAGVGERFEQHRSDRLHVTRAGEGHCAVPAVRLAELLSKSPAVGPELVEGSELAEEPESIGLFLELVEGPLPAEGLSPPFEDEEFEDPEPLETASVTTDDDHESSAGDESTGCACAHLEGA
jgi:hypothetical protein